MFSRPSRFSASARPSHICPGARPHRQLLKKTNHYAERVSLDCERLEDRRVLSAYTVEILDRQNLVPLQVENQMRAAADFTMRNLDRFISWKGTLDLRIDVQPPHPGQDGFTPAILQVMPNGKNATVLEMQTGVDPYPTSPDIGMTVFLGNDGTVKVYGMKFYFDPQPMTYKPANVPNGHCDFIGVLTHEVAHGIGFQFGTSDFTRHVTTVKGLNYFNGPETVKLLGQPLPMTTRGGTHYGNTNLPNNPIHSGLMFEWGNYAGNRLDIGKLDLAVLKDVGLTIKTTEGLPLVDVIDAQAPRLALSQTYVYENVPVGTRVSSLGTTRGSTGYSFQLVGNGWDNSLFRVVGNTIVTNSSIDYETKSFYTLQVRIIDTKGVWTDNLLKIDTIDVQENPSLKTPQYFFMGSSGLPLGSVQVGGDRGTVVSLMFYSRTGAITSTIKDPAVKVYPVRNATGGTTVCLVGTAEAINRNTRYLSYRGNDPSLWASVFATINGRSANYGQTEVKITRLTARIMPLFPVA